MKVCKLSVDAFDVASSVADDIKHICKIIDKRYSGTEAEKQAADFLAQRLSEGTEDVRVETFKTYPQAYYGWINFTVTCILLSFAAYFFSALVSILLLIVGIAPYFLEYVLFKRMYDPLFKQAESQNVYAVKHCEGEVKKRIVLVSHYDAGNEWHTKYAFGAALFVIQRALNIIGAAYLLAINIARWALIGGIGAGIAQGDMLYAGLAGIFFVIPWAATYFFISRKKVIDSANDGLSGAVTAAHALIGLKDVQFENTEVCVLLAGSGAVGMRGAMAFMDAHRQDFGEETAFIVSNILREKKCLQVNARELNCFEKSDGDLLELAFKAAKDLGIDCSKHTPLFSNTESGVFSRAGLRSVGINAVSNHMPDYYRTRYDSFDNISEDCIATGLQLAYSLIGRYSDEYRFELAEREDPQKRVAEDEQPISESEKASEESANENLTEQSEEK